VTVYKQLKGLPAFDPDVTEHNMPDEVRALLSKVRNADGVIISTPEYAHSIPGALKNALDWMVATDVMILKPVVVASVSTSGLGGIRAQTSLINILGAMNASVVVEGAMSVPGAKSKFDQEMTLTDELTKSAIGIAFAAMQRAIDNV